LKRDRITTIAISAIIVILLLSIAFFFKGGLTGFVVSNIGMIEDVNYKDGYIKYDGESAYIRTYESESTMKAGSYSSLSQFYRTYIDFNVPDAQVPDDATVNSVSVKLYIGNNNDDDTVYIYALSGKSTSLSDSELYAECGGAGSTLLVSANSDFNGLSDTQSATVDLGASAITALSNQLTGDWFSICIKSSDEADDDYKKFYSSNQGSYDPELIVDYTGAVVASNNAPVASVSTANLTSFENTHTATITYTPSDDYNTTLNCSLYLGGTLNQSQISDVDTADTFTINGLGIGTYTYYVSCSELTDNGDGLGNFSNTLTFHINDTEAPTVTLRFPADGYNTSSTKIDLNFSVADTFSTSVSCNLTIDGSTPDAMTTDTGLVNNFTRTLSAGSHRWNISCNDSGNNAGYSATRTLTVDVFAPEILLISPANNTINQTTHNLTFYYSASDNITGIKSCSLIIDGSVSTTNYAGANFTGVSLQNGYHNWSINCSDYVGNIHTNGTYFLNISNYDWDNDGHNNTAFGGNDCNDYSYSTSVYIGASCSRSGYTGSTYDSSCSCTGGTVVDNGGGSSSGAEDDETEEETVEEEPEEETSPEEDIPEEEPPVEEPPVEETTEDENAQEESVISEVRQLIAERSGSESAESISASSVSDKVNLSKKVESKDNKTKIDIVIVPDEDIEDFTYFEDIPKCAIELIKAGYINESVIKFNNPDFTVVDEDPLLMWQFDVVKAGEKVDLGYEISKEVLQDCITKLEQAGVSVKMEDINLDSAIRFSPGILPAIKTLFTNVAEFYRQKTAAAIIGTIAGLMILGFAGFQLYMRGPVEKKVKKKLFKKKKVKAKSKK